jgi:hypothetical protein
MRIRQVRFPEPESFGTADCFQQLKFLGKQEVAETKGGIPGKGQCHQKCMPDNSGVEGSETTWRQLDRACFTCLWWDQLVHIPGEIVPLKRNLSISFIPFRLLNTSIEC